MYASQFLHRLSRKFPELSLKLKQAGISGSEEAFLKKTIFSACIMTAGIALILVALTSRLSLSKLTLLFIPAVFVMFFFFFMQMPDVKIKRERQEIGKEIIFSGRFLMVELESGIDIYHSFEGVAANYPVVGKYFRHIIKQVDLGTDVENAINEEVELTPSDDLRKILWQLLNSLRTGADASNSLKSVIEQIVKEQQIMITEYGRKLNPLAMFYMIIAIILPTLGITMLMVVGTLTGIAIDFNALMVILLFIAFMQFMFLSIIRSSRPSVGA
jgi:pilus assembly protein TadC